LTAGALPEPAGSRLPARPLDLVVRGGLLAGPPGEEPRRCDVGVAGGVVARLQPEIAPGEAAEVLDASGCIVVAGLVDLHTHVFAGATFWGVSPGPLAWRTGVTAWVDAGSAGAYALGAFRRLCDEPGAPDVRAFVNISRVGLVDETGEAREERACDAGLCSAAIAEHRDFVVGVKCRLDRFATGDLGVLPLRRAIEAAEAHALPVMAHIGAGPPRIDEVLDLMRPGDIVTHCATGQGMSLVQPDGRVRPSALAARQRGVLFDVGHGSGGFSFRAAETMVAKGFAPDVISSDLHQRSVLGPAFDLPTCLSKYLALGLELNEVVAAATSRPAEAVGMSGSWGHLEVGRTADLALFELEEGNFVLYDSYLEARPATRLLVNRTTLRAGRVLEAVPPERPAHWVACSGPQASLLGSPAACGRRPWAALLQGQGAKAFVPAALEGPVC
jgi:dihydroorotase